MGDDVLQKALARGALDEAGATRLRAQANEEGLSLVALMVREGLLTPEEAWAQAPGAPGEPSFPPGPWQHYEPKALLGQGGMGRVYEAWDRRLKRAVAIKLMSAADTRGKKRFIREARAQAAIHHEHICSIYEVGESEGHPFIAMRLVHGQPLSRLADRLTLEQKVLVVKQVAEGLHEAHRVGLIHRDLKPGNIMVEGLETGKLTALILDFGLAFMPHELGLTLDGSVLGTPAYMPPEQACGDLERLDRRMDVYALGATLYHLFCGEPPYAGSTPAAVLARVLKDEPEPLARRAPYLPRDLQEITSLAMARDPAMRYGSARALAEDLGRFLDGEPVLAQGPSPLYRLGRKLRKHRVASAFAGSALLVLFAALAWGAFNAREADRREALTRRFTTWVEELNALHRYSVLARPHDTGPDRALLRQRMAAVEAETARAGGAAAGPGAYALGHGHLVLGELERARTALERAWSEGYRTPRVAYDLGRVLGGLYQRGRERLAAISDEQRRLALDEQLDATLREPALEMMFQAIGYDVVDPSFLLAQIAYYHDDLEVALEHLDHCRPPPWFYEAGLLRGQIHARAAWLAARSGDRAGAVQAYELAHEALDITRDLAASNDEVLLSLGRLYLARAVADLYDPIETERFVTLGLEAAEAAQRVAPANGEAPRLQAQLLQVRVQRRLPNGEDVGADLTAAAEALHRADALSMEGGRVWYQLGLLQWNLAQRRGLPAKEAIAAATEAQATLACVDASERDANYYNLLGLTAMFLANRGAAAELNQAEAVAAFHMALLLKPDLLGARHNLGVCYYKRALQEEGEARARALAQAATHLVRAHQLAPLHIGPLNYLGRLHLERAWMLHRACADPEPALADAMAYFSQAQALNPKMPHFLNGLHEVAYLRALHSWERGDDPTFDLDEMDELSGRALVLAPKYAFTRQNRAWSFYQRGRFLTEKGRDGGAALGEAIENAQAALALGDFPGARLCLAECRLLLGDIPRERAAARELFESLLHAEQHVEEARIGLARLLKIEAGQAGPHEREPMLEQACILLEQAGDSVYAHLARARLAQLRAEHDPKRLPRARMLRDMVLALRPDMHLTKRLK